MIIILDFVMQRYLLLLRVFLKLMPILKLFDFNRGSCPGVHLLSINAKVNLGDRSSYQHPISLEYSHCETNCYVFEWTKNHEN
jgi:hypothetical protein